ncbi:H/ACA ribonucleoprotein complex subunit 1 [Geodia barretti]|uniref:H/ACA ribonucleoprotein complex subunit n=1 Tax=Geodia barretti TaxID=519541 RepID=A0AA35RNS6_GEOBA|nr:H/ACA ribonucleoprotein complex subunit 1 [Geodia barretti]
MRMRGRNPHACVRTCQHTTMSFRGRGGGRGGGRGRGGRGRGGGRGGRFQHYDYGPPEYVTEVGSFVHPCEEDLVCKGSIEKVPYFNAPIYLENKSQIGKVDEIFGPMNSYYFSVKLLPDMKATSFKSEQKFFIDPMKLLPLGRFLPRPKSKHIDVWKSCMQCVCFGPAASGKVEKRGGGRGGE